MDDCLFCKIVSGDIPSYKIYEDDDFLAFLDIFPHTEGYTLVIPKAHHRWVWDVPNIGKYFEVCKKIANHYKKITNKDAVYGWILGEEVPHAHVRIIPDKNDTYIKNVEKFLTEEKEVGIIKQLPEVEALKIQKKYVLKND